MKKTKQVPLKSEESLLKARGYTIERTLGEGSYSKVKAAKWRKPDTNESLSVAIKVINKNTAPAEFLEKFWPREKSIMQIISHKNIVKMMEIFQEGSKVYMTLEKASRGDLLDYVRLKGPLKEVEARTYFNDLCNGIQYLHGLSIVHRDLKCENLLLFERHNLKIADFGFARRITTTELSSTFCGSAAYAAPELLKGEPYEGSIADCWSMGVILFIMVCSRMPYSDCSINELVEQQAKPMKFPHKKSLNSDFIDLVQKTLNFDLTKRFRLTQIMQHTWTTFVKQPSIGDQRKLIESESGVGSNIQATQISDNAIQPVVAEAKLVLFIWLLISCLQIKYFCRVKNIFEFTY